MGYRQKIVGRRMQKITGISRRFYYGSIRNSSKKQMGNSVAVPVIEAIAKAMLEAYEKGEQHN